MALALPASVQRAEAQAYDISFSGGNVSGSAVLTTNGSSGGGFNVNFVQGTITDTDISASPLAITGLSSYASSDNLVFPSGGAPGSGLELSNSGLSVSTASQGDFNLYAWPASYAVLVQQFNADGSGGTAPGFYKLPSFSLTSHPTVDTAQSYYDETSSPLTQSTVVFEGGTFKPTAGDFLLSAPVILNYQGGTVDATNGIFFLDGSISGPGGLTVSGGGVVLNAANTYMGGTTVDSGSVLAIQGTISALPGDVLNNGALQFTYMGAATYAGVISGTGYVQVADLSAPLILTGNNTATGALYVFSGNTVQLGNGGTSGAWAGNIADGGSLIFDRSGTVTYGGVISDFNTDTGSVTQEGSGTLILTGANTYTGGTTIDLGSTIQLGNGGTTGSVAGDITDNGILTFDHSTMLTYGGAISGSGGVTVESTGEIVLTGTNTYSGGTTVSSGSLSISSDGNLGTGGTLTLKNGTTLFTTATGTFAHNVTVAGDPTFNVASGTTTTWSGQITDGASAGDVEVDGGGTLALTNTSNSYSGGTLVKGGSTLLIDNDGELGNTSGGLTLGDATTSGTLQLLASFNLASTRTITLGTGGGTIDLNGFDTTISQGIGGAGGLTIAGTPGSTLTLTGTNTYSGGTTINGGNEIKIGNGGTTGSITGDVVDNAFLVFDRSDDITFAGNISGSGQVQIIGGGTTTFTGTNTFDSTLYIDSGPVVLGDGTTAGTITSDVFFSGYNTSLTFDEPTDVTYGGSISGFGGSGNTVVIKGSGKITLSGDNSGLNGNTIVQSGSLSISSNNNLSNGTLELDNGTTLFTTATGTFTHDVTVAGDPTFNVASGTTTTWSGEIDDGASAGTVEVDGGGTLALTNTSNSYSGGTVVKGGSTLLIDDDGELGYTSGGLTLGDAATSGTLQNASGFVISGTRAITLGAGGGTIDIDGHTTLISQGITGDGGLTVINSAGPSEFLSLTGTNTYLGGTTIGAGVKLGIGNHGTTGSIIGDVLDNGTLNFDRTDTGVVFAGNISGSGIVNIVESSGGVVFTGTNTYSGTTTIGGSLTLGDGTTAGTITGNAALLISSSTLKFDEPTNVTYAGRIAGLGHVVIDGPGVITLTNTSNSYTGGTVVEGGSTLEVDSDGELGAATGGLTLGGAASAGTLQLLASFDLSNTRPVALGAGGGTINTNGFNTTISQAISGGSLTKAGAGTLTLSGTSSYTGGTTVQAGTLSVNGSIASSAVTVDSGATLGGTGTVGSTTVSSGGTLAPGNSIGTLHVNGNLALAAGSTYSVEVSPTAADETIVSGTASLAGGLLLSPSSGTYTRGAVYTLVNSTGALTGTFSSITLNGSFSPNVVAVVKYDANDAFLELDASAFIWGANPGTTDWNTASNWTYGAVPTAVDNASFGATTKAAIDITQATSVASLQFSAGAPAYTFNVTGSAGGAASLVIGGTGIVDNSSNAPNFVVSGVSGDLGTLEFDNSSMAGDAIITANAFGQVIFTGTSNAGSARLIAASGGTVDVSGLSASGTSAGSIEGAGSFVLGAKALAVGGLGTNTTVSGVISGTGGSLVKVGGGTLTLAGANTYSGGTTISAGTLQIGDGGAAGSIASNVTDNAALVFNRSDALVFDAIVSGYGSVSQSGSGSLTLTGTSSYTGPTSVNAGTLVVNGSIAASSGVTVNSGATLAGSGTVAKTSVLAGGTVAPGNNGVGTLQVAGNLSLASGSHYAFDSTPTASDLLKVTGSASLAGALAAAPSGSYSYNQVIPVVSATGGVSGTFDGFTTGNFGPNLIAVLGYGPNSAFLTLEPVTISGLLPAGASIDETEVADAIDTAMANDGARALFSPLANLSPGGLDNVLSQLSGELPNGAADGGFQIMGSFLEALLDPFIDGRGGVTGAGGPALAFAPDMDERAPVRLAMNDSSASSDAPGVSLVDASGGASSGGSVSRGPVSVWGTAFGGWSNRQGDLAGLGTHSTNSSDGALALGADYRPESGDAVIGAALSIGQTWWDIAGGLGNGHSDVWQVGLYGSKRFDQFYLSGAAAYAQSNARTIRTTTYAGTDVYAAKFDAQSEGLRAEAGRRFLTGDDIGVTPYVAVTAVDFRTPGYVESTVSGSALFALAYAKKTQSDVMHELGVQLDEMLSPEGTGLIDIHARLGWLHDYSTGLSEQADFNALPGASFLVYGASAPRDAARISIGLQAGLAEGVSFTLKAQSDLSNSSQIYSGNAMMAYRW